jgi:prevent-host-death family protein
VTTKTISSDQARAKWRELLDTAVAGNHIIIERNGKPVAVLVPYQDYARPGGERQPGVVRQPGVAREGTAVYQTPNWEAIKTELTAEIKAELMSEAAASEDWAAQLQQLRQQIAATGGVMAAQTKDEIVEQLRQTRQELVEAEYAHLY